MTVSRDSNNEAEQALSDLTGLGYKSQQQLRLIGIHNVSDLRSAGAIKTFALLQRAGLKPSLNFLYALAGALEGRDWRDMARNEKDRLFAELAALEEYELRISDPD